MNHTIVHRFLETFIISFTKEPNSGKKVSKYRWDKRKFSTTTINDCQLLSQKFRQKILVIKTNSFAWELLTIDDIKKIVHFGILIHVLS